MHFTKMKINFRNYFSAELLQNMVKYSIIYVEKLVSLHLAVDEKVENLFKYVEKP